MALATFMSMTMDDVLKTMPKGSTVVAYAQGHGYEKQLKELEEKYPDLLFNVLESRKWREVNPLTIIDDADRPAYAYIELDFDRSYVEDPDPSVKPHDPDDLSPLGFQLSEVSRLNTLASVLTRRHVLNIVCYNAVAWWFYHYVNTSGEDNPNDVVAYVVPLPSKWQFKGAKNARIIHDSIYCIPVSRVYDINLTGSSQWSIYGQECTMQYLRTQIKSFK